MAQRADIELLNHSLENLGQTFQRNRVIDEDKRKNIANEMLHQSMAEAQQEHYGAEESHYGAQEKHYQNIEDKQNDVLQHQKSQEALQGLEKAHKQLSDNVARGAMTPEQANAAAKRIVDSIKKGTDTILSNSPFAAMMDDPDADLFTKPDARANGKLPAAAIQIANHVQDLNSQADEAENSGDDDSAEQLRTTAKVLQDHLKKNPQRPISIGSTTTKVPDPNNPFGDLGHSTSRVFAVPGEDGSLTPVAPAGAPTAAAPIPGTTGAPPAPLDAKQRKPGTRYKTPKGEMTWTGTGWMQ